VPPTSKAEWPRPAAFFQRHLGRGYLNALIDLYGIAVDDLAADALSQFDSQFTLAGSGRTYYGNDWSADILSAFFRFILCLD
jgi:hypothetical protein